MGTMAGNLLSATIDASRTLGQEIRTERQAERCENHSGQPERDYFFDPLSSCIGATSRSVCNESAEFRAAQASSEPKPSL